MSGSTLRVFLSSVNKDFTELRNQLAEWLRALLRSDVEFSLLEDNELCTLDANSQVRRMNVTTQQELGAGGDTLLHHLADHIRQCHLVIHLIGPSAGTAAGTCDRFWLAVKDLPALADCTDSQIRSQVTYTQWEAYLALVYHRKLLVCRSNCVDPALPGENFVHWQRLKRDGVHRNVTFKNIEDLKPQIESQCRHIYSQFFGKRTFDLLQMSKLPTQLIGRKKELDELSKAYEFACTADRPVVVMVTGAPGMGKTALVQTWLSSLDSGRADRFDYAFCWVNPNQGGPRAVIEAEKLTNSVAALSLDFFEKATSFCEGVILNRDVTVTPNKRGEFCGTIFRSLGSLVVLDGVESFQRLPDANCDNARWQDRELEDLVQQFLAETGDRVAKAPCMLVLTSYWPLPMNATEHFRVITLNELDGSDAVKFLEEFAVPPSIKLVPVTTDSVSPREVFRRAAESVGFIPLGLSLLAGYVCFRFKGRLHMVKHEGRFQLESLELGSDPVDNNFGADIEHLRNIADTWLQYLASKPDVNDHPPIQQEVMAGMRALLEVLAVFQKPVATDDMLLLQNLPVPTREVLFDPLQLTSHNFQEAANHLKNYRLIARNKLGEYTFSHHFIRDRVIRLLNQRERLADWEAANELLYCQHASRGQNWEKEYAIDPSPAILERSLRENFLACGYGARSIKTRQVAFALCMSKLHESDDDHPTWSLLSAKSDELGLLSNFFSNPWKEIYPGLETWEANHSVNQIEIFNETGYILQKLCRFNDSIEAFECAVSRWDREYQNVVSEHDKLQVLKSRIRDLVLLAKSFYMQLRLDEMQKLVHLLREDLNDLECICIATGTDGHFRLIDGYSALAWIQHILGCAYTKNEMWLKYRNLLETGTKKEPLYHCQKMLAHARCLIEEGHYQSAFDVIDKSDQVCQNYISRHPNSLHQRRKLNVDMFFNRWLQGATLVRMGEQSLAARTILQEAATAFFDLDVLDGWMYCELELARLAVQRLAIAEPQVELRQAEHHIQTVQNFIDHSPVPRFLLELRIIQAQLEYWRFLQTRDSKCLERSHTLTAQAKLTVEQAGYKRKVAEIDLIQSSLKDH